MASTLEQGIGLVNFEVYLSGTDRLLGLAQLELPTLEMATVDISGAGIMGQISMPIRANLNSLEVKLTWRRLEKAAATLSAHKSVHLSLYSDQEGIDAATNEFSDPSHYVEIVGVPKTLNLGKWEPSSTVDAETTLEVITLKYTVDGEERIEFDKLNYICRVNGEDYAEPYRLAVGLR